MTARYLFDVTPTPISGRVAFREAHAQRRGVDSRTNLPQLGQNSDRFGALIIS